jgi:hypothetical protein
MTYITEYQKYFSLLPLEIFRGFHDYSIFKDEQSNAFTKGLSVLRVESCATTPNGVTLHIHDDIMTKEHSSNFKTVPCFIHTLWLEVSGFIFPSAHPLQSTCVNVREGGWTWSTGQHTLQQRVIARHP